MASVVIDESTPEEQIEAEISADDISFSERLLTETELEADDIETCVPEQS
jgi:hypothetical protein